MSVMSWLARIVAGGGVVVGLGLSLLYLLQEKLIYVPRVPGVTNDLVYKPDAFGFKFEDVWLKAADGVKLHSWFMWPRTWAEGVLATKPCIIFFQENAGNMSWRLPFLKLLANHLNCSILALSYRGYGLSGGKPNERGLQMDAEAALRYLLNYRTDIDRNNISLFGRSLGGAVAINLAARHSNEIKAVMVENTFTSIVDVAPKLLPFLGLFLGRNRHFNFLVRNKWDNQRDIARLTQLPVMLLSSLQDEMLPPEHMLRLFEVLKEGGATSVVWAEFPEGDHMQTYELCAKEYWLALRTFASSHIQSGDTDWGTDSGDDLRAVKAAAQAVGGNVEHVSYARRRVQAT